MSIRNKESFKRPSETKAKRSYGTPALVCFGKVSALTQSASGCAKSDNASCSGPTGNMGRKP